jgi:hypothetical protein
VGGHKGQIIMGQAEEQIKEYMDNLEQHYIEEQQDIICPFCGEDGFDKIGLKYHLQTYCEPYKELVV